jgi:hypothetical protein
VILALSATTICMAAYSQDGGPVYTPYQQIKAPVGSTVAASDSKSDLLIASVESVFADKDLCCGRGSALEDAIVSADSGSLRRVGEKLRGRYYLSDGSAITIFDNYWTGSSVRAEDIIASLQSHHALIIDWDGRLYVLFGAIFDLNKYPSGVEERVIRSFMLVDTRYSDAKRYVTFDRQKNDFGKVNALLELGLHRGN